MSANNSWSGINTFTKQILTDTTYNNIGIGYQTLNNGYSSCGQNNIALGYQAGYNCTNSTNHDNIMIGYQCGRSLNASCSDNIFLGHWAGYNIQTIQVVLGTASETVLIKGTVSCWSNISALNFTSTNDVVLSGHLGMKGDGTQSIFFTDTAGNYFTSTNAFARYFAASSTVYCDYYGTYIWRSSYVNNSHTTTTMQLSNSGALWINGALTQNSDYRIKKRLGDAPSVLERLCNVDMFTYELNNVEESELNIYKSTGNKVGFYAHEIKDAFPDIDTLVSGEKDAVNEDGTIKTQSVDTFQLSNVLMKAIQELNTIVKAQQIQIDYLKTKLSV